MILSPCRPDRELDSMDSGIIAGKREALQLAQRKGYTIIPAATVLWLASSIMMKLPVARLRA
jgi:hypothetical protein